MNAERAANWLRCSGALIGAALALAGCRQDMHDQPRYEPLAASDFFADGTSARPVVEGAVARGQLRTDEVLYTGRADSEPARVFPLPVTRELLARGRERYEIFCSPCHGMLGDGEGMITQRGFRHPPTFHTDRLHQLPVGHYFDAITNGFGAMPSYASRIPVKDRWAIVAYVQALQLSQSASLEDVPASMRSELNAGQ